MIKTKRVYLFLILILCLIFIPIVSAENYQGTLGYSGMLYNYTSGSGTTTSNSGYNDTEIMVHNIDMSGGLKSIVNYGYGAGVLSYDGVSSGASTSATFRISNGTWTTSGVATNKTGAIIGHGTIGYQRIYNTAIPPVDVGSYVYVTISDWNVSGLSGDGFVYVEYDTAALNNIKFKTSATGRIVSELLNGQAALGVRGSGNTVTYQTGYGSWGLTNSRDVSTTADYFVMNGAGLGLQGTITKTEGLSQALIYSGTTGAALAGESQLTGDTFNFTMPEQAIVIGIKDSMSYQYNTSVLFSAGTPTAIPTQTTGGAPMFNVSGTPTPTPTPQGGINGTIDTVVKVTVYDYVNMSPISGLAIGLRDSNDAGAGWYNVTAANGVYTFSGYGSGGTKPFVDHHTYLFTFSKTGYVTETRTFVYTPGLNDIGYYLQTSAYTPTASNFVLGVKLFSTVTGEIETPLTGTVTLSNQSSAWTSVSSNPQAGVVMYSGLNPAYSYKVDAALTGYQYATSYFSSASNMAGSTQWLYVYLSPTTQPVSNYQLTVSPSMGSYSDTYTLKITGDLSNAVDVSFKFYSASQSFMSFTSGSGYADYHYVGGAWKQWDGSTWSIASSLPQSVSVTIPSYHGADTVYTVTAYITSSTGTSYQASSALNIISSGSSTCWLYAWGGATAIPTQLYPFNYYVNNQNAGTWNNGTFTVSDMANLKLYYPAGTKLQYQISSAGYVSSSFKSYTVPMTDSCFLEATLYPETPTLPAGNVTLYGTVRQAGATSGNSSSGNPVIGYPISGAKITLSDGQTAYTSSMGQVTFIVANSTFYTGTAEKSGFTSASSSITTGAGNNVLNFVLLPMTVTTPIGGYTVRPTGVYVTPTGQLVPPTNWSAGASCGSPSGNATLKEIMLNYMACNGVETKEAQSALIGLMIMVFSGALLGKYGKGMGAIAGVVAGAAISFYMQLFPFWVFIFVCVAAGIVFAGKIFGFGDK